MKRHSLYSSTSVSEIVYTVLPRLSLSQFYHKDLEYHSVCPLVRIGTPHSPSPASVWVPPGTKGWGAHSPAGEGVGVFQFG
jgi:hypothetical protein